MTLNCSIRKHLVPPLGHLPLASISPALLQETFDASRASSARVPIHIIQRVLGHADIRVTRKHDLHLGTGNARAAIDGNLVFKNLPAPRRAAVHILDTVGRIRRRQSPCHFGRIRLG
jgi:hypothetical protein